MMSPLFDNKSYWIAGGIAVEPEVTCSDNGSLHVKVLLQMLEGA